MTATTAPPPALRTPSGSVVGRLYNAIFVAFCSLRLTVVLITGLLVGSLVGMFVDQTKTFEEHARIWNAGAPPGGVTFKYQLFASLEFHDVFHSWWFSVLILLLALNLIGCSIERLPKIWIDIRHPDPRLTTRKERGIRQRTAYSVKDAEAFEKAFVASVGRAEGPVVLDEDGARYVFAEKQKWARTGVYVVHTALLLVMFGSMATTILGFDGTMGIVEGSANRFAFGKGPAGLRFRQDVGFTVACTDFRLKQFVDGAPMDFESDLIVYDGGREVMRKTIQVNDPLEYKGFTLYQASYQPVPGDERVQLAIGRPGGPKTTYSVTPGTQIEVPGSDVTYTPLEIINQYANLGAAVRVQERRGGSTPTNFLVFRDYPDFDEQVRRGPFALHYKGADKTYMTGIQVGKVPGVGVVFGGFALMFVGMYMAFFMSHRRYWLRLEKDAQGRWKAVVAGAARRHQYAFEEEFDALTRALGGLAGVSPLQGKGTKA